MAQTVKTPRFWMNELQFCDFNNHNPLVNELYNSTFNTLPVQPKTPLMNYDETYQQYFANMNLPYKLNNPFIAILGHKNLDDFGMIGDEDHSDPVNINFENRNYKKGWSLKTTGGNLTQISISSGTNPTIGSIIIGSYFDVPHSPDLSLTMTHDYSGIKKTSTRGGSTLVNAQYHKNPKWGDLGAWEIDRGNTDINLSRSGRRTWNLTFSFFSDAQIWPDSLNLTNMNDIDSEDGIDGGLNTGTDFYGQVIHRSAGGALPFIFSPNSNNSDSLDNYYICMFDQDSFSLSQTSPTLYNIQLNIMEVW